MELLKLCQSKKDYFVVTTNVDGLFIKAGFPTNKVHEVHGNYSKEFTDVTLIHINPDFDVAQSDAEYNLCMGVKDAFWLYRKLCNV